jgi:hypothetical protein
MPDTTDLAGTLAIIRARAEAQITTLPLYWQDEDNFDLPDEPAPFVFFEMIVRRGRIAGFGAGRGANLYRTPAELNAYVLIPRGQGLPVAATYAEAVAAAFRSFRSGGVSCFEATLHPMGEGEALVPPGLSSAAGNYACVVVSVSLHFDQIG